MTKRKYVLQALEHKNTGTVPYYINFTADAYNLYGERLLRDFYNKEVQEDLKEGKIDFFHAVNLSIGNYLVDISAPWWDWDYKNLPEVYADPDEEPDVMPPVIHPDEESMQALYERSKYISEKYQVFTCAMIWGSHWEKAYFTRGIENFLADLAAYPEFSQKLLNLIIDLNMESLPRLVSCPYIDGILLGSDWGTQRDLIMSPTTWHEMIKPGEKKEYDFLKAHNKTVMVHSCGQILRIMPDLIELGVDILNPVQPECMDLTFLKNTYGDNLTYWGGISTQQTLPYGTPDEVREETKNVIELMSRNGGYITGPSQAIQTDVPYENLKALIETAQSYT